MTVGTPCVEWEHCAKDSESHKCHGKQEVLPTVGYGVVLLSSIILLTGSFASWKINPLPKEFFLWLILLSVGVFGFFITGAYLRHVARQVNPEKHHNRDYHKIYQRI